MPTANAPPWLAFAPTPMAVAWSLVACAPSPNAVADWCVATVPWPTAVDVAPLALELVPMEMAFLLVALALVPAAKELCSSAFAPVPMAVASCPLAVAVVTVSPLRITELVPVPFSTVAATAGVPASSRATESALRQKRGAAFFRLPERPLLRLPQAAVSSETAVAVPLAWFQMVL